MMKSAWLAVVGLTVVVLAGCGPAPVPGMDGGEGRPPSADAGRADAGALPDAGPARPDAGVPDAGTSMPDAGDGCARPEAAVEAVIGPGGGSMTLCGATVRITAGSLSRELTFRFSRRRAEVVPAPPFVVDGLLYQLEGPGLPEVTLSLPHSGDQEGIQLHEWSAAAGWVPMGLCEVGPSLATQTVIGTGTFALLRDARNVPTSPRGLGQANVDVTLGARTALYTSGQQGHAAESALPSGERMVVLQVSATDASVLQIEFLEGPGDALEPWSVVHVDQAGELHDWSFISRGVVPMDLTLVRLGAHLQGRLVGFLVDEAGTRTRLDASFEATVGDWKELPLRVCGE